MSSPAQATPRHGGDGPRFHRLRPRHPLPPPHRLPRRPRLALRPHRLHLDPLTSRPATHRLPPRRLLTNPPESLSPPPAPISPLGTIAILFGRHTFEAPLFGASFQLILGLGMTSSTTPRVNVPPGRPNFRQLFPHRIAADDLRVRQDSGHFEQSLRVNSTYFGHLSNTH